jgi:hypothetical protein
MAISAQPKPLANRVQVVGPHGAIFGLDDVIALSRLGAILAIPVILAVLAILAILAILAVLAILGIARVATFQEQDYGLALFGGGRVEEVTLGLLAVAACARSIKSPPRDPRDPPVPFLAGFGAY